MTSAVQICNRALQKLGAARIVSLTQDSVEARECNASYERVLDAELRAHPWNFAIKRAVLAPEADPLPDGTSLFPLPPDCLRILPGKNARDWKVEGRAIVATGDRVELRYIHRPADPEHFDALFVEALASSLAEELAEVLTQSNTKKDEAADQYRQAIADARRVNAIENVSAEPPEDEWISVRR